MRRGHLMELSFEGLEIQKLDMPTDRPQRVDTKSEIICLVMMFSSTVMVFKMKKHGSFFVFSADSSKKLVTVWVRYLIAPEISY